MQVRVLHATCICKSHAAPACMRARVRSAACIGRPRTSTHARICHACAACGGHLQAKCNTHGHVRSATCLGRSQTTRARHETRVLQAGQQTEMAAASEAPIPARRGRACCGRAEPRSRSPSGGRASSAWNANENGIADSSPRELTAPLMSLCTKLEKHGQHISVRNTAVQPCSCERFLPPARPCNKCGPPDTPEYS